jgi:hypothetical protein
VLFSLLVLLASARGPFKANALSGSCCLNSTQQWNGLAIAAEFDRLSGTDIFTRLYADYEQSTAIPEYQLLLESTAIDIILAPTLPP